MAKDEELKIDNQSTRTTDEAVKKAYTEMQEQANKHPVLTDENFKLRPQEIDMSEISQSIRDQLNYRHMNDSSIALNIIIQQLNAIENILFISLTEEQKKKVNAILDGKDKQSKLEKEVN